MTDSFPYIDLILLPSTSEHWYAPSRMVPPFPSTISWSSRSDITGCGVSGSNSFELAPSSPHMVAGELDHGALQAQADPEKGNLVSARVRYGHDLSFDAAVAEAARHQDAVDAAKSSSTPSGFFSRSSESIRTMSSRALFATAPCRIASYIERYESWSEIYFPTTAIRTSLSGLWSEFLNLSHAGNLEAASRPS